MAGKNRIKQILDAVLHISQVEQLGRAVIQGIRRRIEKMHFYAVSTVLSSSLGSAWRLLDTTALRGELKRPCIPAILRPKFELTEGGQRLTTYDPMDYVTEDEWYACGGFPFIAPQDLEDAIKEADSKPKDDNRNCLICRVGWKASQDGENCWSCDSPGELGPAK